MIISLLIVFSLCVAYLNVNILNVYASISNSTYTATIGSQTIPFADYPVGSYFTDNGSACNDHSSCGGGSWRNDTCNCKSTWNGVALNSTSCYGFANMVFYRLFGHTTYSQTTKVVSNISASTINSSYLYNLFTNGTVKAGAHIRNSTHSMIFMGCDSSYIYTYEGNYDGQCRVGVIRRTWSEMVTYLQSKNGIAFIQMPNSYPNAYTEAPSYYVVCNTSEASSITATSAVFSGTFTNPASAKIIKRGYQWGATPEMCNYTEFDCNITWDDGLSHNMTNLSPNTTYYYKLVVKCEDGSYIYGNTKTVTTLSMPDTEKPVISNLFARNISSKSFTIQCNLYDNSNIARVWFVVYSPDGEYQFGTGASNGFFSYKFDTENYGGAGIYSVHIYAFDENDNSSGMYSTGEFLVEDDNVSPTIENISVSNIGNKVFEIKCDLKDNVGIVRMWMVIYAPNGEHQFEIPASQGEFIYPINTELYGGIGEYVVHMYAFDAAENSSGMYSTGSIIPTYTIKYIVNTDSEDIETQLKKYDSNITLSSEIPTRTGYIFTEWNTKTDGSGVSYNPGATYTENNNLVLYAQWKSVIPHTESTVTKSGTKLIIDMNVHNINSPFDILIVGYKENRLVTMKRVLYNEQNSPYTLEGDIDEIKVMVWSDLSTLKPLCDAEVIQSNEFITE